MYLKSWRLLRHNFFCLSVSNLYNKLKCLFLAFIVLYFFNLLFYSYPKKFDFPSQPSTLSDTVGITASPQICHWSSCIAFRVEMRWRRHLVLYSPPPYWRVKKSQGRICLRYVFFIREFTQERDSLTSIVNHNTIGVGGWLGGLGRRRREIGWGAGVKSLTC